MKNEENILKRLKRRVNSDRASVLLEFGILAPILVFTILFAAGFTRTLYIEQQVEIATRLCSELEMHQAYGSRKSGDKAAIPSSRAKSVVREYLNVALAKEGLGSFGTAAQNRVYCRGMSIVTPGPVEQLIAKFKSFTTPSADDNMFIKLLKKLLSGLADIFTFGCLDYATNVIGSDRAVMTSVSVLVDPLFSGQKWFQWYNDDWTRVVPEAQRLDESKVGAYDRTLFNNQRVRYWCVMPYLDTQPLAQDTFIRWLPKTFEQWAGISLIDDD